MAAGAAGLELVGPSAPGVGALGARGHHAAPRVGRRGGPAEVLGGSNLAANVASLLDGLDDLVLRQRPRAARATVEALDGERLGGPVEVVAGQPDLFGVAVELAGGPGAVVEVGRQPRGGRGGWRFARRLGGAHEEGA